MPRTRSLAWAELKFGLICRLRAGHGGAADLRRRRRRRLLLAELPLKVKFDNVAGLMAGSPVRVAGVEVGSVDRRRAVGANGVEVWFNIQRRHATARHRSIDGVDRLDLAARRRRRGHHAGARRHADSGMGLRAVRRRRRQHCAADERRPGPGINEARLLVEDIRKGRGTVGKLFTDDSVYREFNDLRRARRSA